MAQSLDCSRVGESHIYRVTDYNGDNYNSGTDALDIDLQSSAYTCTITNTEPTTNQNRVWYCMTLKGTATPKREMVRNMRLIQTFYTNKGSNFRMGFESAEDMKEFLADSFKISLTELRCCNIRRQLGC